MSCYYDIIYLDNCSKAFLFYKHNDSKYTLTIKFKLLNTNLNKFTFITQKVYVLDKNINENAIDALRLLIKLSKSNQSTNIMTQLETETLKYRSS